MWAIIGGSGFESFEEFETLELLDRETPFGLCSSGIRRVKMAGQEILFISRHGEDHELLPTEINFRANIFALKRYGVRRVLSISAVGSLRDELKPGDLVIPHQYIDRTKSLRSHTFCGEGIVGHVSLAEPVQTDLISFISSIQQGFEILIFSFNKTAVVIEGPTFSTRGESHSYRQLEADIIGMTNYPEYALAREAGICYLPLSFVTDYDCWKEDAPHVTLQEVLDVMKNNNAKAYQIASKIVNDCGLRSEGCSEDGLKNALMNSLESLSQKQRDWLNVLFD